MEKTLVGWCFEPSQPLGVTSELNTNSSLYLVTLQTSQSTPTAIFLQYNYFKHTHIHKITHISIKPQTFYIRVKIFLHALSPDVILCG